MKDNVAGVRLLDAPYHVDKLYSYLIPDAISDEIYPGRFVFLPFGAGNRVEKAVVVSTRRLSVDEKLKPIRAVDDCAFTDLTPEMISLAAWLTETTFCTFGDAVRTIIPSGALSDVGYVYCVAPGADASKLNTKAQTVFEFIASEPGRDIGSLKKEFGSDIVRSLAAMTESGVIYRKFVSSSGMKQQYSGFVTLTREGKAAAENPAGVRGEKQKKLLKHLSEMPEDSSVAIESLKCELGDVAVQIRSLGAKGYISVEYADKFRTPYASPAYKQPDVELNEEQKAARDKVKSMLDAGKAAAVLMRGVTGSGKTRVIKSLIDEVTARGRSVIVLVPEISLTPQMVGLLSSYYGDKVAVLHSSLSNGERFDEWRRMKDGRANICVGTRSAVFAPFDSIGLIVIDEEQEGSYKSDMSPRYHARDVARWRCAAHDAVMLLSSATPSVESMYKAESGVYSLAELNKRYGGAPMPEAFICDLRGEVMQSPLGSILAGEISANFAHSEQSILFINRRGYNNFVTCGMCGTTITCPHCSVSLTYHAHSRRGVGDPSVAERRKWGYLSCHWCGYRAGVPDVCPECGSNHLQFMGFGTQMVEEELTKMLPDARLLRMDADTTGAKFSYDRMLESFRRGEENILLGTQMVTKGHDFPNVTLVGVVLADSSLFVDDYRAGERTFELITQVIGRAGRAGKAGRAIIQTYCPDNKVIECAASQDYDSFYKNEIAMRKALTFPPFCDIALVTFTSADEAEVTNASGLFAERLNREIAGAYSDARMVIYGPFEAPVYRVNEKYRRRLVIKCKNNRRTRELFRDLLVEFGKKASKKVQIALDMNPSSI